MVLPPKDLWDDPEGLVAYYTVQAIPIDPNPGVLVASVVVSLLGSYATLLLLGRRTSSRGWRNHLLLIAAAICFACVAVWGMHFVGMMCIRLDASPNYVWYVQFSKGMTALSLFVPLISTAFAFWFAGSEREVKAWRVVSAGIFAGLTIVFMHYSASFTLPFLRVSYTAVTVVFAIVIACLAAVVALFAFFTFRAQWEDSFWKRCLCSLVLTTAVCGMHYLGIGGTSYRTKPNVLPAFLIGSKSQNVRLTISISALCGAIILLSVCLAALDFYTRQRVRAQARHIAVASLAFDQYGKMLVKADGTVPLQMIETGAALSSVLAELDPRQPTFQWMYSLSFNWQLLKPFVPRIFASITNRTLSELRDAEREQTVGESFRSRFLEASVLLAQQLNLSVEALGMLFDRVLTTGTRSPHAPEPQEKASRDDESSIHGITLRLQASEGVVLFLCRQIDNAPPSSVDYPATAQGSQASVDKVDAWLQKGWRLADTRFYSRTLADHLGVSKPEMDIFLSACKTYAKRANRPVVQSTGTYLGLFGVRPHPSHGLDVLVYNFARHQVPAYRLPEIQYPITASMRGWIRECSGCTMAEVLQRATHAVQQSDADENSSHSSRGDEHLVQFQSAIAVAIDTLATALRSWPNVHDVARLSPEILELPASASDDEVPAQMIVIEVILPAPAIRLSPVQSRASGVQAPQLHSGRHETDKPPAPFVYTPWSLFAKSQNTLIRGKLWIEACKMTGNDLLRLYPPMITDLAVEAMDDEKRAMKRGITNPFSDKHRRPTKTTAYAMAPRSKASSGKHERHGSVPSSDDFAQSELSVIVDDEKHMSSVPAPSLHLIDETSAPAAVDAHTQIGLSGQGVKKSLVALKGMADPNNVEDTTVKQPRVGAPIYAHIRDKLDGWYLRSMRTLERDDMTNQLDGYDWQSTSRGP